MEFYIFLISLLITVVVESKPLDSSGDFRVDNEIEYRKAEKNKPVEQQNRKNPVSAFKRPAEGLTNQRKNDVIVETSGKSDGKTEGSSLASNQQYNPFPNLLAPLLQRLQFSPQTFFQDRLSQLKDSLVNLGLVLPGNNATTSKQFATMNGLLNLIGLNDSGFYTDRLEPAGFLGGNGWFANKGGILGGPGAIYSTGSLLTDYPTPYKK